MPPPGKKQQRIPPQILRRAPCFGWALASFSKREASHHLNLNLTTSSARLHPPRLQPPFLLFPNHTLHTLQPSINKPRPIAIRILQQIRNLVQLNPQSRSSESRLLFTSCSFELRRQTPTSPFSHFRHHSDNARGRPLRPVHPQRPGCQHGRHATARRSWRQCENSGSASCKLRCFFLMLSSRGGFFLVRRFAPDCPTPDDDDRPSYPPDLSCRQLRLIGATHQFFSSSVGYRRQAILYVVEREINSRHTSRRQTRWWCLSESRPCPLANTIDTSNMEVSSELTTMQFDDSLRPLSS